MLIFSNLHIKFYQRFVFICFEIEDKLDGCQNIFSFQIRIVIQGLHFIYHDVYHPLIGETLYDIKLFLQLFSSRDLKDPVLRMANFRIFGHVTF